MNEIIGRIHEKQELETALNSKEAELIAVYGRRRVGKTYLIKNFFQNKKCIFFQTTGIYKKHSKEQLDRFSKEISSTFYKGIPIKNPSNWMDAFDFLTQTLQGLPKSQNIIIFLDELPWMASRKSGLISAIEYFWNRHWANDHRIKLILCGSSASWIIKKIIKNRGGLHNRVTRKIKLAPFSLEETQSFLSYLGYPANYTQTLKIYTTMGGVPFYLKQIKKNLSIEQNVDKLFFNPASQFIDEFDEVFSSLFTHSEQYKEIIKIIASCQDGVSRQAIDEKTKLTSKGGRLSSRLEDLEYAGFIISFIPFGHDKRGIFYRLTDEYCCFYLKWIEPIKKQLKQNHISNYWQDTVTTPEYFGWMGYSFENICYKHIKQIKKALNIPDRSFASPWRYTPKKESSKQGAQIDLVFDRKDSAITICEIKYSEKPFVIDKSYASQLLNKIKIFLARTKTDKQIFLCIISANGLKDTMYSEELVQATVTLEDMCKKL